jgi:CheY-like chemotaxis protein
MTAGSPNRRANFLFALHCVLSNQPWQPFFHRRLTRQLGSMTASRQVADTRKGGSTMSQFNALVVDTSPSMRNYIRAILQQELSFHEIHEGKDADDALQILKSGRFINWIFSSWEMPGLSTHDLLETVRNSPNSASAHFVLMSANDENAVRSIAIQEGVADYLCKPFFPHQMVHMVHRLTGLEERRGTERFKVHMHCEIDMGFDSFHHYGAELVDISMTGCKLKTSQVKPGSGHIDDYANVTLLPETGTALHVQARIRRLEFDKFCTDPLRDTEIAVEFVNITPALKEELMSLSTQARNNLSPSGASTRRRIDLELSAKAKPKGIH